MQDGWSSQHNDPILATSIHTGYGNNNNYLIAAKDCDDNKKTVVYCYEDVKENVKKIKDQYDMEVKLI